MQQERYDVIFTQQSFIAEFTSKGPKGFITKTILFQETSHPDIFNLAFGDKYPDSEDFDDKSVTNNGDTHIVLATVAYTVDVFTEQYPNVWILAKGNSSARNRLYQIGINKFFDQITKNYEIIAETEDSWEPYVKGINYTGFAIKRKI